MSLKTCRYMPHGTMVDKRTVGDTYKALPRSLDRSLTSGARATRKSVYFCRDIIERKDEAHLFSGQSWTNQMFSERKCFFSEVIEVLV